MNNIFKRVSVRKYLDKPVEAEKIQSILKAAMAAPSSRNQQPWEFYVVTNKGIIEKIADCHQYSKCAAGAPVVFVPCFKADMPLPASVNIDMSAAVENMLLQITDLDLGAVWIGITPKEDRVAYIREAMNIPAELTPFCLIPCGYPDKEYTQKDRFDLARVHYID